MLSPSLVNMDGDIVEQLGVRFAHASFDWLVLIRSPERDLRLSRSRGSRPVRTRHHRPTEKVSRFVVILYQVGHAESRVIVHDG
eukprot:IDg23646t1